jgi:Protein of unknown function (DUF3237)
MQAISPAPNCEFVYEAIVTIANTESLGQSPLGERHIVPITGGTFLGDKLRGTVLAGGADRQLIRADGVKELDALYEMRTHDGVVITVHNQVTIDFPKPDAGGKRYAFSTVKLTAPQGAYDWLNKRVFVGTVDGLMPAQQAVCIRVYQLV